METAVNHNNWGRVHVMPWWTWHHRDLPYIHEDFNNSDDVRAWQQLGWTQQRFTGDLYDMRSPEPDWINPFRAWLPMKHWSWSVYRMRPGDALPQHRDTYQRFSEIYGIADINTIRRYVIFLENWQSGHYFEIDGVPITNWVTGTGIYWQGDAPHLAANLGSEPRYTLQITGVVSRSNL